MAIVYPVTLPQYVLNGPGTTPQNNVVRTVTDTGPAKQRPRGTKFIEVIDGCSLYLTESEYKDVFLPFFKSTLGNGAKAFTWRHPIEDTEVDVRFVNGAYSLERPSKDCYKLSFQLETV